MGQVESDPEDRLHPGDVQESSPLGGDEGKLGESFYIPQLPNPTSAELSLKIKMWPALWATFCVGGGTATCMVVVSTPGFTGVSKSTTHPPSSSLVLTKGTK